jgi:hypothetical protein
MNQSIMDPPSTIFNRFKLQLVYQKTRCVLFRRYLVDTSSDPAEEAFRTKCVDAAMKILGHLETIYDASVDGGKLSTMPYFLDTFSAHDFLLAAMVLCLELGRLRKLGTSQSSETQRRIQSMKALLETTYRVYTKPLSTSKGVPDKAVKALEIILNKARTPRKSQL